MKNFNDEHFPIYGIISTPKLECVVTGVTGRWSEFSYVQNICAHNNCPIEGGVYQRDVDQGV